MPPPGAPQPAGEKSGGGMMEGIAKMFSTEEGKKMMRSQMAMGLKMQYGGLAKDLKLDPKVADQVFALLGDRQASLTEATFGAMKGGTLDEAATKEIAAKSETLKKEYDEKLKAVLGDTGMTQLQDYERTLGDRMMLNMHEQQFTAAGAPLEQTQRDSLLQIMKDERLKTPASVFESANGGLPAPRAAGRDAGAEPGSGECAAGVLQAAARDAEVWGEDGQGDVQGIGRRGHDFGLDVRHHRGEGEIVREAAAISGDARGACACRVFFVPMRSILL
jgi:hypothetical protein